MPTAYIYIHFIHMRLAIKIKTVPDLLVCLGF